ncbi:uncharacterized protein LOC132727951 [Ruditapes philippinarum]|uniref:uncharacterized protein LOC132727951 n=1 Tax=Ruditapes philippinarum TaxID=129788 RepID=UPI00295B3813|nr:uncharacterized protein LOC132727951 [Ruditapes philippinarum]
MGKILLQFTFIVVSCLGLIEGSTKKGLAVDPRTFLCDDFQAFTNFAWWYDWGANLDLIKGESGCNNIDANVDTHVPMVWGYGSYFSQYYLNNEAAFLMAFNEPNHMTQSNIDPVLAASVWGEVEALANGRPIVSPSPARCDGPNCLCSTEEWFDAFFANCVDCRVDYLATHMYSCNPYETMEFLENLYNKYGLKIWLTEFACPNTWNDAVQFAYMEAVLPMLESAAYIYKYSWFVSRVTFETRTDFIDMSASLLEPYSSQLTWLGEYYNSFVWQE